MKTLVYATAGVLTSSLLLIAPASAQDQGQRASSGSYDAGYQDGLRAAREKYAGDIVERIRGGNESGENEEEQEGSGAEFRLIRGNTRLDVKCGSEEATEKCVESAILLMEHAGFETREAKAAPKPPAPAPQRQ